MDGAFGQTSLTPAGGVRTDRMHFRIVRSLFVDTFLSVMKP